MEKSLFFSVKNCKNHHFFERNAITVAEIILKTEKHGKAEIGNSEWTKSLSLILRSVSMNQQLRGVSDEHANCKRKSTEKKKNIKLVHATATVKIQTKTGQLMRWHATQSKM